MCFTGFALTLSVMSLMEDIYSKKYHEKLVTIFKKLSKLRPVSGETLRKSEKRNYC